jgi:hypothetical protein
VAVGPAVSVGGTVSVGRTGVFVGRGVLVGRGRVLVGRGVAVSVGASGVRVDVGVWVGGDVRVGTGVEVGSDTWVAVGFSEVETSVAAMIVGAFVGCADPQAANNRTPAATVTSSSPCHLQVLSDPFCRARLRTSSLIGHLPDTDLLPHGDGCIPRSQLGNQGPVRYQYTIDRVEIQNESGLTEVTVCAMLVTTMCVDRTYATT